MSCVEDEVELAPTFVVRAASWPVSRIEGLADVALAEAAARVDSEGTAAARSRFAEAYEASVALQRAKLWAATAGDPRFLRALAITNPDLGQRVDGKVLPPTRNKRARHLETTLYMYLARAAWRTEPCDLWASVGLGTFGDGSRCTDRDARSRRYAFAPDLRPFAAMIAALAATKEYARSGQFKVNPTLRRDARANFCFEVRGEGGGLVPRRARHDDGLERLVRALEDGRARTYDELAAALSIASSLDDDSVSSALDACIRGGLLVGGLAFPASFTSAWDALWKASRALTVTHASAWRIAVRRVRRICRRLERDVDSMSVARVREAQESTARAVAELAGSLGVSPPALPRAVLRCDAALGKVLVVGPAERAALARTLAEVVAFEERDGLDAAARAAHARRVLGEVAAPPEASRSAGPGDESGAPPPFVIEEFWRAGGRDPGLGETLATWSSWLIRDVDAVVWGERRTGTGSSLDVPTRSRGAFDSGPLGALVVRPGDVSLRVVGLTPEVVPSYGRYMPLVGGPATRHPLHAWYAARLREAARHANVALVELTSPCESLPNALARPDFGLPSYDRWAASPSSVRLDGATIVFSRGALGGAPVARVSAETRPVSVVFFSPAHVGGADPQIEALLLTSFRAVPSWIPMGAPFTCEVERSRPSPVVRLPCGATVRPRRTVISGQALEALVSLDAPERFLRFQALAREHRWPSLVAVARDGEAPVLMARDSALALEAVLEGARAGALYMSVEEPTENAWLTDEDGERYVAELVVPYVRRTHGWSNLGLAADERRASAA